jgi:uncharacterized protein YheU (UPF0270 family)
MPKDDDATRGDRAGTGEEPVEVPWTALDPATLRRVAEEFVTRDGTDYGARERSLEEKTEALLGQLRSGEARLYYEARSGSVHIVPARPVR